MRWGKLLLLVSLVMLTAASCGRGSGTQVTTMISEATIATGIDFQNQASNQITTVAAGTPSIYLSAKISNPTRKTAVRVRWIKSPSSIIATEDFNGGRSGRSEFDYDAGARMSYFASQVDRPGTSWPLGDYTAEIFLDGRLNQTVPFKVVSDSDASQDAAESQVRRLIFGDRVDAENRLLNSASSFSTATAQIFASIDLVRVNPGAEIEVAVRYLREDISVSSYKVEYQSGTNLSVEIDGNQVFRKSRPDRVWPTGSYEVIVYIDGLKARTATFTIR